MKPVLIFLVTFTLVFSANGQSLKLPKDAEKGDFLMVTVYESSQRMGNKSKIVVSDGEKLLKTKELEGFFEPDDVKIIAKTLNTIKDNGYALVQSNSGGGSGGPRVAITNYVFQKE